MGIFKPTLYDLLKDIIEEIGNIESMNEALSWRKWDKKMLKKLDRWNDITYRWGKQNEPNTL